MRTGLCRVLLVDDSALVRTSMQTALEPYGLEFGHAENGEVAIAKASASPWDLIFLDVVMPVMDGPTALKAIRARGITTPVVLVTSVSTAAVVAAAIKLGGVQYIAKPFTPELIRAIAAKTLRLDPTVLQAPPRVLVQHTDPAIPRRLAKLLPAHVAIDASDSIAQSLDLAEERDHGLVLIESQDALEEIGAVAGVLRRAVPGASMFALSDAATEGSHWRADDALDGVLPRALTDSLARGFLYSNFLRPLVFIEGTQVQVAGFQGPAIYLPVYLARVRRLLVERCAVLPDSIIDLANLPADPDAVIELVAHVNDALREAGAAPSFHLGALHDLAAPQLANVLLAA
ncbi:MAG: response regulator [Deltaproteobacteria bacterium]|nr:response regulator [Deltaproteobacteria bacterium]